MRLSLRWAERSQARLRRAQPGRGAVRHRPGRRRSGAARCDSAQALIDIGFHGYAIGGLAVGEPQEVMLAMLERPPRCCRPTGRAISWASARRTIFSRAVRARHRHVRLRDADALRAPGQAFTRFGKINLRNARHADDPTPARSDCRLLRRRTYSRAYLHHLVKAGEMLVRCC